MSWAFLCALVFVLGLSLFVSISRRGELRRMERTIRERERVVRHGAAEAQLQHPVIDLSRCLGCGTCVAVCPEDGVLDLVHGQAMVVHGARCVGVAACERECPVGAITVTLGNLQDRDDVPAVSEDLEAIGSPGLFLAGELTAHALIKTAVEHGTAVAAEVARRTEQDQPADGDRDPALLDLCVVGAGPAGLACSLEATRLGLRFVTLEQEPGPGGTVAKYPRRKLVMTQPVDLPLWGRLDSSTYTKEQLMELWHEIATEHRLPIVNSQQVVDIERDDRGDWLVRTRALETADHAARGTARGSVRGTAGGTAQATARHTVPSRSRARGAVRTWRARHVCLALGRRGTPRKLGVPGEDLPKVAYSLLDARSYQGRRILVVGGGDSAVEAAVGLAETGNEVTLSYRKDGFFRIRSRNHERIERCLDDGELDVIFQSRVLAIHPDAVEIAVERGGTTRTVTLPNDEVFVMVGGTPPIELLDRAGVSFDPSLRETPLPPDERGTGLIRSLCIGFALTLCALLWALWHADYYGLSAAERPAHPKHAYLRPELGIGLGFGIAAVVLIVLNLLYLVRRSSKTRFELGSLRLWMTSHVATGILALLFAALHAAMEPRGTVGGRSFWALAVLLLTGAIGRYFYAFVPRAANGRELELSEVRGRLGRVSEEWDRGHRAFREHARDVVNAMVEDRQWRGSFFGRVLALLGSKRDLRAAYAQIEAEGERHGVDSGQIEETKDLAQRAYRTALMAAHYEDLRAVLSTWRYVHRWVAALLVLLVVVHVVQALFYSPFFFGGGAR